MSNAANSIRKGLEQSINTLRHWEQGKREPEGARHAPICSSLSGPRR